MSQPTFTIWPAAPAAESLRRTVADAWQRVRNRAWQQGAAHHLVLRVRVPDLDPLDAFLASDDEERFFWSHPADGLERAATGEVWSLELQAGAAEDRFDVAAREVGDLLERLEVIGDDAPPSAGPVVHAGFAYADRGVASEGSAWASFPAARLVLARRQITRVDDATFECRLVEVGPDAPDDGWMALFEGATERETGTPPQHADEIEGPSYSVQADRPHARYEAQVAAALDEIERGGFEKVVLARALEVRHAGEFGLRQFLEQLRAAYPACATFAVAHGEDQLVSASPERLVALQGEVIRTSALAGSAPRGRSPESDARLGRELLACPKNLAEHGAVKRTIVAALEKAARNVRAADVPALLRLAGIQHLETPIEARLDTDAGRPGEALIGLVSALHPTPAVGGLPAELADAFIEAHEALDRGWYAAPVGFIGADGSGEFRVALRSALLRTEVSADGAVCSMARLFAGAGVVEGSDPHGELVETRIKLRALLAPLTEI